MTTLDKAIEHQIDLERYKVNISRKYTAYLNTLANDVHTMLSALSNTRGDINKAIVGINSLIDTVYIKVGIDYLEDIRSLLESEYPYVASSVGTTIPPEDTEKLISATLISLILGLSLYDHLLAQKTSLKRVIRAQLISGYLNKVHISEIARGIRGTKVNKYKDGIWNPANNKLSTITKTGIQQYTTDAKVKVFKGYSPESLSKYIWISVLDSRTTAICRSRSNKIYNIGAGPVPPAHSNCRSIIHRYSEDLDIPESYSHWLRRQPRSTIDDVLGKGKAELFVSGKLTLDKFVTESGRELTLQQLKTKLGSA